uniref:Uncharacterized protein n=1 Tax=Anguilla anguilla TaxID=7936 RepID=A0A0E9Q3Q6_ANGAN
MVNFLGCALYHLSCSLSHTLSTTFFFSNYKLYDIQLPY